MKCGWR